MTSSGDQAGGLTKGRDGVPSWDGTTSSFQAYLEAAELYEQGTPYHKRYLCGPKLQAELSGTAKRHVVGQRPDWLSHGQGVQTLLNHLRSCLGKPQLAELTELLGQYFKGSRRHHGESMGGYISRKCELYIRAQQAMSRVQPLHTPTAVTSGWTPRYHDGYYSGGYSRRSSVDSRASEAESEAETQGSQAAAPVAETNHEPIEGNQTPWDWNYEWWSSQNWGWSGWSGSSSGTWAWSRPEETTTSPPRVLPELVPEFVQAWFLLQDSGLEQGEKNLVLTAIKGEMNLQKMAQELRTQFPEAEIKRRDGQHSRRYHQGLMGDLAEENYPAEEETTEHDTAFAAEEELTEEGYALWNSATEEAEQAFAALQGARRTLREARDRQKQVRLNRRYFRGPDSGPRSSSGGRDDSKITCFSCGQTGHRTANCPKPKPPQKPPENMAPFVCFAGDVESEPTSTEAPGPHGRNEGLEQSLSAQALSASTITTQEAVLQGKCVIDSGATKSLGSILALEQVVRNMDGAVNHVDTADRPRFGFGNSSEDTCVSTVHLNVSASGKPGTLKVHALDAGEGPILFSIDALRSLGAIVDFSADLMVLRNLDRYKLIRLERSSTGHQLFPLTEDFYQNAEASVMEAGTLVEFTSLRKRRVPSMTDLSREELRLALAQLGELPPSAWTKVELRLRLEQVTGEDMTQKIKKKPAERSPYEILVAQLNASSKNKRNLIRFCENDLQMNNLDQWSIPRIQHEAMKKIYQHAEAHPSDLVGFGRHASLTYRQIREEQEGYCQWLVNESKKGPDECDPRLMRLAAWLKQEGDIEMKTTTSKIDVLKLKAATKAASKGAASSSSEGDHSLIRDMYETIESLKEEVAALKGEPTRKASTQRATKSEEGYPTTTKASSP
ncbi:GIP [Symbiodinium sp. CCMP2592]|nr:GIP [Symbiodinium sp. CCMP2592]